MNRLFLFLFFMIFFMQNIFAEAIVVEAKNIRASDDKIIAEEDASLVYNDIILHSDDIHIYENNSVYLIGQVDGVYNELNIVASSFNILRNSSNNTTRVFAEQVLLYENDSFYIDAKNITSYNASLINAKDARISRCCSINETPDWSVKFSDANIYKDYIVGYNMFLNIKNTSVFYSPYFIYPLANRRKTGILIPSIGQHSDYGVFYSQRYFWDISDSSDITVGAGFFTKGEPKYDFEYRKVFSDASKIDFYTSITNQDASKYNISSRGYINSSVEINEYSPLKYIEGYNISFDSHYYFDKNYKTQYWLLDSNYYTKDDLKTSDRESFYSVFGRVNTKYIEPSILYRSNKTYYDKSYFGANHTELNLGKSLNKIGNTDLKLIYNISASSVDATSTRYDRSIGGNRSYNRANSNIALELPIKTEAGEFSILVGHVNTGWENTSSEMPSETESFLDPINFKQFDTLTRSLGYYNLSYKAKNYEEQIDDYKIIVKNHFLYENVERVDQEKYPKIIAYDYIQDKSSLSYIFNTKVQGLNEELSLTFIPTYDFSYEKAFLSSGVLDYNKRFFIQDIKYSNKIVDAKGSLSSSFSEKTTLMNNFTRGYVEYGNSNNFSYDFKSYLELSLEQKLGDFKLTGNSIYSSKDKKAYNLANSQNTFKSFFVEYIKDCWSISIGVTDTFIKDINSKPATNTLLQLGIGFDATGESSINLFKKETVTPILPDDLRQ